MKYQSNEILLDTDVALDHLADCQPFAEYAHLLFALVETGELTVCVSSLSFSDLYYILRKLKGHTDALALLGKLKLLVRVSAVAAIPLGLFASERDSISSSRNVTASRRLRIPTGFRQKAQGCKLGQSGSDRATLGHRPPYLPNRNAVVAHRSLRTATSA